jgi:hypothetical protein
MKPPEREAMIRLVLDELERQDAERLHQECDDELDDYYAPVPARARFLAQVAREKRRAQATGDVAPLRALFPFSLIAEFIQPLKRKQGERRPYRDPITYFARFGLRAVADDVKRIRALLGHKRRRGANSPSAEEIAGHRHGMTEDEVRAAIKLLSRQ